MLEIDASPLGATKRFTSRYARGLIVGKFAPLHAGHQHLIETALAECDALTVMVYAVPDFPDMPQPVRAGWLRAIYPNFDVREPPDAPPDVSSDDVHRRYVRDYLNRHAINVDAVFTSEAYGDGFAHVLGVPHRMVDRARVVAPTSGTAIRSNLAASREFLSPLVRAHFGV